MIGASGARSGCSGFVCSSGVELLAGAGDSDGVAKMQRPPAFRGPCPLAMSVEFRGSWLGWLVIEADRREFVLMIHDDKNSNWNSDTTNDHIYIYKILQMIIYTIVTNS